MIRFALASMVAGTLLASTHVLSAQASTPMMVDVGGHKLNVRVTGTPRPGRCIWSLGRILLMGPQV